MSALPSQCLSGSLACGVCGDLLSTWCAAQEHCKRKHSQDQPLEIKKGAAKEKRDRRLLAKKHKRNPSTTSSFHRQPMIAINTRCSPAKQRLSAHQEPRLTAVLGGQLATGAKPVTIGVLRGRKRMVWTRLDLFPEALRRRRSPWWTRRKTCTLTATFFS